MKFENAEFETSFGTSKQLPPSQYPEIAFAGRSNVGKSSLINKILNRKSLARVSSVPGKTITINFYKVGDVKLVDLPGYGYAKVAFSEKKRWSEMMEGYFSSNRQIKLVVQLVDMRHPPTADDLDMIRFLEATGYKYIIAMTKSDKLNKTQRAERLAAIEKELEGISNAVKIPFSSINGEGVQEIKAAIESAVES